MTEFSANLGFLWTELSLPDAIRAAARAGFCAVECHWPYDTPAADVSAALNKTGLSMLGLNTIRGNAGDNGLAALTGRQDEARAAIDQALEYAVATGAKAVHVMAGIAQGDDAHETFIDNLRHACAQARPDGIMILIEPLNAYDAPGYFLQTSAQALGIISQVNAPELKLMFDCYHIQIMEGDLTRRLQNCLPVIGHIQFASVPERGDPSKGEINYRHIFAQIAQMGYAAPLGAEYKPDGPTEPTLGWLNW
ncbi:MAG: TIM barrel protein [Rhodobacteraceae bacterium]|nr:TIM barrel protein [Paracoccaceae bacterium]